MNITIKAGGGRGFGLSVTLVWLGMVCLAKAETGTVVAWGNNLEGQTNVPSGLINVVAVAVGSTGDHSLALKSDGTVVSWGSDWKGQLVIPAGFSNVVAVAAGGFHNLVLRQDGTVVASGVGGIPVGAFPNYGQTQVPAGLSGVVAISAGGYFSLVLKDDGTVVAWGDNSAGEINMPIGLSNVVAIAAGSFHSLALKDDGTVVSWGESVSGETNVPPGLTNVVAVAAGTYFSLALKRDGTVVAWGEGVYGETAVPAGLSNVVAIAAGAYHGLALKNDGTVVGWGAIAQGFPDYGQAQVPAGLTNVVGIAAGSGHSVVLRSDVQPVVLGQPIGRVLYSGATVLLSATAIALAPVHYQWQLNGTNIAGANRNWFSLPDVEPANAGNYSLVVSNASGTAISSNAVLNVIVSSPIITVQPTNQVITLGHDATNATLAVTAEGSWPLSYQWRFNGTNMVDATNASMVLAAVQSANSGGYDVVITNAYGTIVSSNLTLTVVVSPPSILVQPNDQAIVLGSNGTNVIFAVTADGSWPLSYQWQTNATSIAGATNASLTLANVEFADQAVYRVVVTNPYGTVTSSNATLAVAVSPPSILVQPTNQAIVLGPTATNVVFTVTADGSWPLSYRWQFNGTNVVGATNTSLTLTNVVFADAGNYDVRVSNPYGTATSSNATLTVMVSPPSIAVQPANQVITVGTNATNVTFTVAADGSWPLIYQWQFNGTNIVGATNASLTLIGVQSVNAGNYSVGVSNLYGSVTSSNANLTVIVSPPNITAQPTNQTFLVGAGLTNAAISVAATGSWPLTFQWQINGTNLEGATRALLVLTNAQVTNEGIYSVVVSNPYGLVVSSNAFLNVVDLAEALNATNLTWTTGGDRPWFPETTVTFDGAAAARSGGVDYGQTSILQAVATGPGTLVFQWKIYSAYSYGPSSLSFLVNGIEMVNISGTVNWRQQTFYLGDGTQILQFNSNDGSFSDAAWIDQVSFIPGATGPTIATSPVNWTVSAGQSASFSASAYGTPPLNYQWLFNGTVALDGATNTSLTLTNVQAANAGSYSMIARSAYGTNTSLSATLTVNPSLPSIAVQPADQIMFPGSNVTFAVGVIGTEPMAYQWQLNGTNIVGAGKATLTLADTEAVDGGSYRVVVTNTAGSRISLTAYLIKNVPLDFRTLAGLAGNIGTNDGVGNAVRFNKPWDIAVDPGGTAYVADRLNHIIRKIAPDGAVSTFAGSPGITGTNNGAGGAARFNRKR